MLLAFAVVLTPVIGVTACDGDRPAVASDVSASMPIVSESAETSGESDPDASAASACRHVVQHGSTCAELAMVGTSPEQTGGTIDPGVYVLEAVYSYVDACDGPTGYYAQKTLTFAAADYRAIEADGIGSKTEARLGSTNVSAGGWTTDADRLTLAAVCPSGRAPTTYSYTAAGPGLTIWRDGHREVYRRQP